MKAFNEPDAARKMRVLIVEDRPLARDELRHLLSLHPDVEVAAECEDTAGAWPLLAAGEFDGVFLDIDIETEGRRAGMDLAIRLDRAEFGKKPWIVFTTGYEEFALTAHQVTPLGYLMKPLSDAALAAVLGKIRKSRQAPPMVREKVEIRHRKTIQGEKTGCTKYVAAEEILYIQSENGADNVRIKLVVGEILEGVSEPLKNWDANYRELIQIHKSHLANINLIDGLIPHPFRDDSFKVTFKGCADELPVGRKFLQQLRDALKGRCK